MSIHEDTDWSIDFEEDDDDALVGAYWVCNISLEGDGLLCFKSGNVGLRGCIKFTADYLRRLADDVEAEAVRFEQAGV